ncbi:hypothetical protein C8Q77DRAFT_591921 [Trametes polyzona]|nr:hypothetical protein C8Q77DRAFT_591921 [Trametes polyzona]
MGCGVTVPISYNTTHYNTVVCRPWSDLGLTRADRGLTLQGQTSGQSQHVMDLSRNFPGWSDIRNWVGQHASPPITIAGNRPSPSLTC